MTRQEKYPDTATFHYHNANPKNRMGDDCVVRAISTVLEQSWEQTVREMTELGLRSGYVLNDSHTYIKYLESKGLTRMKQPRKADNTKYTGVEFCRILQQTGQASQRIFAHIGGNHAVAIVDGKVNDIWDSTGGTIGMWFVQHPFNI